MDIEELIEIGQKWRDAIEWAEERWLRVDLRHIEEPDLIRNAFSLLENDVPLAVEYPDGKAAHPPYTPSQVRLLADKPFRKITHEEEQYHEALQEVRKKLGRHPTRQCEASTASGNRCRSNALPYPKFPYCHVHSTIQDRLENKNLQTVEKKMLNDALDRIGYDKVHYQDKRP